MTGVYGVFTVGVFRSVLLFGFSVVGWLYLLSVIVALLPYSLLLCSLRAFSWLFVIGGSVIGCSDCLFARSTMASNMVYVVVVLW